MFVRSADDMRSAIPMVNELLSLRRSTGAATGVVLGVLVGEELDRSLPETARAEAETGVTLRDSVALSGIWSLCWFESRAARGSAESGERRRRILDLVLRGEAARSAGGDPSPRRLFYPVVAPSEGRHEIAALHDALEIQYPALTIVRKAFADDPASTGIVESAWSGPPSRSFALGRPLRSG